MKKQHGFTLIELVMVITIMGILAAVAVPKFVSLNADARFASMKAVRGSLASTAAMTHSKFLATTPPPLTIIVEGTTVTFATVFASGYPKADASLAAAAGITATDYTIIPVSSLATANSPATSATETAFIPVSVSGTTVGLTCFVKYAEPVSATAAPVITMPALATNC